MRRPIYLDAAASAPPDPRVVDLLLHHLTTTGHGNAGSYTHSFGTQARKAVEHARDQLASALAARRSEIFFTSGATESNNLAILGQAADRGNNIVITAIEHPAVLEPARILEETRGVHVTRVAPSNKGCVRAEDVLAAIRPNTRLVSVMHVNNETGVIQPIEAIAAGLPESILFHVDASQSFGKIPTQFPRVDLMSLSAHKMGGPQGIGALMVRKRARQGIQPRTFGGGQEGGLRPGTQPVPLIAAFGLAAELAAQELDARHAAATRLRQRLLAALQPAGYVLNGDPDHASPYIVNLSFPGLDNQQVTEAWAEIAAVSNGSACTSRQIHCSHVLHAMGLDDAQAASALRLSWDHQTAADQEPDFDAMLRTLTALPREPQHG